MSLDRSIAHGREHRNPYRGAKAIDYICTNHSSCGWCKRDWMHKNDKRELRQIQGLEAYERENA